MERRYRSYPLWRSVRRGGLCGRVPWRAIIYPSNKRGAGIDVGTSLGIADCQDEVGGGCSSSGSGTSGPSCCISYPDGSRTKGRVGYSRASYRDDRTQRLTGRWHWIALRHSTEPSHAPCTGSRPRRYTSDRGSRSSATSYWASNTCWLVSLYVSLPSMLVSAPTLFQIILEVRTAALKDGQGAGAWGK